MKKLIIAALLFAGCAKETQQPPKDEIRFEAKTEYGGIRIMKDGQEIVNTEIRGTWTHTIPAAKGDYEINFVSVPPGFSWTYVYHNGKMVAVKEESHTRRTMWTITYKHP